MTLSYTAPTHIPTDNTYESERERQRKRGTYHGAMPAHGSMPAHGAMPVNGNANVPPAYLAAQVAGNHDTTGTNGMPLQRVTDGGINAMVSQLGGLGLHGQGAMMSNGYVTADGQYFLSYAPSGVPAGVPALPGYGHLHETPSGAYPAPGQYMQAALGMPMQFVPFPTGRPGLAAERSDVSSKDAPVPGLDNRRSSYSTTESTPATPFFGSTTTRDQGAHVAVSDRSTYTTPSPQQVVANGAIQPPKGFHAIPIPFNADFDALLKREPAIPPAVPAVFTPQENMKTLEQSLANHIPGNRNVYIRGLHPTTDDETLRKYAERFGQVETSKAIIDTATGACKGFGFAKFLDVRDSELCIRGFYRLGYEVGFARVRTPAIDLTPPRWPTDYLQESFNSRLKAEGDEESTNLYISNLPKSMTEIELGAVFLGYTILSSKILRDNLGNSRGVGFARFETREICDQIIKDFTNIKLGEEGLPMQIRYADTPSQKELKRITAERRQFRTNEYNVGAYGTPLVGMHPTIYGQPRYRSISYSDLLPPSSAAAGNTASSEDGSGDEGVTIHVDSPLVANGSSRSSPVKQEKD
ncbi:hypothetical protein DL766_009783 [Monosporascus sp. MC13-8B]|nr:hypothetical protein DL763_004000 [Monosporascus cannonballus]RYP13987.1 hypothetical protein DL766_009783 [Monosporascus sp. MC13-8B]